MVLEGGSKGFSAVNNARPMKKDLQHGCYRKSNVLSYEYYYRTIFKGVSRVAMATIQCF